jgi:hypothetical protein
LFGLSFWHFTDVEQKIPLKGGHHGTRNQKQEAGGVTVPRYRDPFAEMRAEMDRVFDSFLGRSLFDRPALFGRTEAAAK